jgi:hypothetical protein
LLLVVRADKPTISPEQRVDSPATADNTKNIQKTALVAYEKKAPDVQAQSKIRLYGNSTRQTKDFAI